MSADAPELAKLRVALGAINKTVAKLVASNTAVNESLERLNIVARSIEAKIELLTKGEA